MKAILIDVTNMEIKEIEVKNKLDSIYKVLECDCVTAPGYDDRHDVIVDDEGLLKTPYKGFFEIVDSDYANEYEGHGLICSFNCDGDWRSHKLKLEEVKKHINFITYFNINGRIIKAILKRGIDC